MTFVKQSSPGDCSSPLSSGVLVHVPRCLPPRCSLDTQGHVPTLRGRQLMQRTKWVHVARVTNNLYPYCVLFCLGSFGSWSTRTWQFWHTWYPHWVGRHLVLQTQNIADNTLPLSQERLWAAGGCRADCSSTREGAPVGADGLLLGPGAWSYPQASLLHVQYLWWEGGGATVCWHAYLRCIQGAVPYHMWQSPVKIEHYSVRISLALLRSKRSSVELLLRAGLIRAG